MKLFFETSRLLEASSDIPYEFFLKRFHVDEGDPSRSQGRCARGGDDLLTSDGVDKRKGHV